MSELQDQLLVRPVRAGPADPFATDGVSPRRRHVELAAEQVRTAMQDAARAHVDGGSLDGPAVDRSEDLHRWELLATRLLAELMERALIAPPGVLARLGDINRLRVFTVFTHLLLPSAAAGGADLPPAPPAAGTTSSPGLPGSTASAPAPGRKRSRPGRSART